MKQTLNYNQSGFVLPIVVIFGIAFLMIITSVSELAVSNFRQADKNITRNHTRMAADAGIDRSVAEINQDNSWVGTAGEVTLHTGSNYKVAYETSVADVDSDTKTVTSTGYYYEPASASEPTLSVTYSSDLRALATGGNFSVVTGVGGLFMSNNSKIVAGDVHVNGEIEMSNSALIGLSTNNVIVKAAHQNCPDGGGSTYPRLCASDEGEPINMDNNAHIYADVYANNQTNGSQMSNSGLVSSSGVAVEPLPTHDRQAQIDSVAETHTESWAHCNGNETRIWPANLHVTGSAEFSKKCEIYITGDVWIDDIMTLSNQAKIIVDESVDTRIPTIMIDGSNGFSMSNGSQIVSNSQGTGARIITYYSSDSCSPDCNDVTGDALYNSRELETIKLSNNAKAPESILYAKWTQVSISNGGDIGALVGQTVELTNSAAVTFGASTGGGSTNKTWLIDNYNREF